MVYQQRQAHEKKFSVKNSVSIVKNFKNDKEQEKEKFLFVKCINIQGLTNLKMCEVQKLIENNTILCLTETQLKIEKIRIPENLNSYTSMRELNDKKGGGLMVLWSKGQDVKEKEIQGSEVKDIMYVMCESTDLCFYIIIVYFPCGMKEEDRKRRKDMKKEIDKFIEGKQNQPVMIIGDFNGHVGFLGNQDLDEDEGLCIYWNGWRNTI